MTRTYVTASSRPQLDAPAGTRRLRNWRRLVAIPVALLLAVALVSPGVAFAAEGLSGYGETTKKEEPKKPEEPKKTEEPKKAEEPKKTEEPKSGTSPSKETTTPSKESAPETKSTAPSTSEPKSTLPFTGLDLRLVIAVGILMMGAGFSIVVVQRRQRKR